MPMYLRRSSRIPKASNKSPQKSPSSDKEVTQQRGKRQRTGPRKTKADDSVVNTDEGRDRDIIDIINSTHDTQHVAEEDGGKFVEVVDKGVDESDEDCCSVTSSVASGPSFQHNATTRKPKPSPGMCSACWKLYQKAKKMKAPIKNKLLDNDPKSLSCDQWVLIKNWTQRRLPKARGKLLTHVQLVKRRLQVKNMEEQTEQEPSVCLRQHTFLQRNLRRHVRVPVKKERKKNRRKRKREHSQGPRVAKQQRLQRISINCPDNSGRSSSPGVEGSTEQEMDDSENTDVTVELISTSVTLETTEPKEDPPRRRAPKKTGGFRDLLAQMRGNSSMIVRETR